MNTFLASGTGLSAYICNAEECLTWIIVLLNILTIFYLVFCAFFRVTKPVKVIGYVWASALAVGTVAVVAVHTCVFTILSAVFTALILMAVMSVVLDKGVFAAPAVEDGNKKKPSGAYVVHKTDDGNYVFILYKDNKVPVCKSQYKYGSIEEVKRAIGVCRENGYIAAVEDRTKSWIEYVNHPKFELIEDGGQFFFRMSLTSESVMLRSEAFASSEQCEKYLRAARNVVLSEKVYFAENDVVSAFGFLKTPSEKKVVKTEVKKVEVEKISPAAIEEAAVSESEDRASGVVFNSERKTLWVLYAELSEVQRGYFDKIRACAEAKDKVKSSESKDAYTVLYGRDKIVKLRIRKNAVEAIFFVTDSAFKKLKGESDAKVKETPTVIRITDDEYFRLALETVDYKYDSVIKERNEKKAAARKSAKAEN